MAFGRFDPFAAPLGNVRYLRRAVVHWGVFLRLKMIGSTGDITAEKALAQELDRTRRQLYDAIEGLSEGFAPFDPDDRLIVCNSRYARLFRETAGVEIALGMSVRNLYTRRTVSTVGDGPGWLASRVARAPAQRRRIREQELSGDVWLQVNDQRTKDGSLVSVYTDVTRLSIVSRNLKRPGTQLK